MKTEIKWQLHVILISEQFEQGSSVFPYFLLTSNLFLEPKAVLQVVFFKFPKSLYGGLTFFNLLNLNLNKHD